MYETTMKALDESQNQFDDIQEDNDKMAYKNDSESQKTAC